MEYNIMEEYNFVENEINVIYKLLCEYSKNSKLLIKRILNEISICQSNLNLVIYELDKYIKDNNNSELIDINIKLSNINKTLINIFKDNNK